MNKITKLERPIHHHPLQKNTLSDTFFLYYLKSPGFLFYVIVFNIFKRKFRRNHSGELFENII